MKNKRLQKFLLILVVATWGMVAVRIYGTVVSGGEEEEKSEQPDSPTGRMRPAFVYKADVRDPFYFAASVHRVDSSHSRALSQKVVWTPPPLKLTGILQSKTRRKTAVLESTIGGNVFFVSEGDTLSGTKILKIGPHEVSYLFQKQKSQWTLEAQ